MILTEEISDEFVPRAISYMRLNMGADLSVLKLARHVGVSAPQLSRRFRNANQPSPSAMLTGIRMERARELLIAHDLTLKEIADQVGYRALSAFGRAFLRAWGVPPGRLRRSRNSS
jgi:transcriptional regulator GlxA family with amidase domain